MSNFNPDNELWKLASGGDQEAFGHLFLRHYPILFQYGSKISPDKANLEDSIQQLFLELWQNRKKQKPVHMRSFLLQALKNKLYNSFRNNRQSAEPLENSEEPFELSHENFIVSREDESESVQKVLNALNQLTPRQKEVIYLRIYQDMSYDETSKVLGLNNQVTRNLLCEALKNFRKKF
jgi:RNA polymerase sigma factor (sigma-70 family)